MKPGDRFFSVDGLRIYQIAEFTPHSIPIAHFVQNVTPLSEIAEDLLAQDLDAELQRIQP